MLWERPHETLFIRVDQPRTTAPGGLVTKFECRSFYVPCVRGPQLRPLFEPENKSVLTDLTVLLFEANLSLCLRSLIPFAIRGLIFFRPMRSLTLPSLRKSPNQQSLRFSGLPARRTFWSHLTNIDPTILAKSNADRS